jgi:hypothetical protein
MSDDNGKTESKVRYGRDGRQLSGAAVTGGPGRPKGSKNKFVTQIPREEFNALKLLCYEVYLMSCAHDRCNFRALERGNRKERLQVLMARLGLETSPGQPGAALIPHANRS